MAHPRRLRGVLYTGPAAYFVTSCTRDRRNVFHDIEFGRQAVMQLLARASAHRFEVSAYCLMPDHAHLLLTAVGEDAALGPLVRGWKQATGYLWSRRGEGRLWQPGYYERILRENESILPFARYIIENPVRAGLVGSVGSYPLAGSSRYRLDEIVDAVLMDDGRPRRQN